jgi:hypothetical protein
MGILHTKINNRITCIKQEYQNNKDVNHQGMKGSFNESELSELIEKVIPTRYIVTKGIVENSKDEQSNETDIIIYDNDILPRYVKNDLSFIPIEAVKYVFEVKSSLNATELKTTIDKFYNYRKMGGISPTVLFAFSSDIQGNELERYKKNDQNFFINPIISVICVSDKSYSFKIVEEHFLKDFFTNEKWLELWSKNGGLNVNEAFSEAKEALTDNEVLEKMNRAQFALAIKASIQLDGHMRTLNDRNLVMNDIEFNKIKFKIHKWVQVETDDSIENFEILSFLSGISNTLSKEAFGKYLLKNGNENFKVCAICYEDMWGNISCEDFDKDGLNYDVNSFSFSYHSDSETNTHKMTFNIKDNKSLERNI